MSKLNGAYDEALAKLSQKTNAGTALVVRNIIEAKNALAEFEQTMVAAEVEEWLVKDLTTRMADQISSDIAAMCILLNKSFRDDIMPLVIQVTADVKSSKKLQ